VYGGDVMELQLGLGGTVVRSEGVKCPQLT